MPDLRLAGAWLAQGHRRMGAKFPGSRDRWPALALGLLVLGMVLARWLLDRWVRRVNRRAGAGLVRGATHTVPAVR